MYVLCLTAYVTDSTFYTTVQGNVHTQITLAIICYICSIYKYLQLMSLLQISHLLHLFYLQILTAYITTANQSSVTFVLFTNTYSLCH